MPLQLAYLVNQYPAVSHTFIRREIRALERRGFNVKRVSIRGWDAPLADPLDQEERSRTEFLLRRGFAGLIGPLARCLLGSPRRFMQTLALVYRSARASDGALPSHLAYFAEACLLRLWMADWGVKHLHAHFGTNGAQVAMLAHSLGGPNYSVTVHGSEEFDRPEALMLGEKLRRASFAVAVSSFGRSQVCRWIESAHWPKVHIVRCGIEGSFHAGSTSATAREPQFVCVGRLHDHKGQLLLVEAAHSLAQKGIEIKVVLAGDGDGRAAIESLVAKYALHDHVRITGWISGAQVRNELLAARALVLPSFAEGLPVVIMEAMALRRPVLSTYVAGIPELVRPGESGWLFPAGDVDALTDAIQQCLATPDDVLARMGEAARAQVLARHDIDTEAAKLAALFEQTIASINPRRA